MWCKGGPNEKEKEIEGLIIEGACLMHDGMCFHLSRVLFVAVVDSEVLQGLGNIEPGVHQHTKLPCYRGLRPSSPTSWP